MYKERKKMDTRKAYVYAYDSDDEGDFEELLSASNIKVKNNDTREEEDFDMDCIKNDSRGFLSWLSYGEGIEGWATKDAINNAEIENGGLTGTIECLHADETWEEEATGERDLADCDIDAVLDRYFGKDDFGHIIKIRGIFFLTYDWDADSDVM